MDLLKARGLVVPDEPFALHVLEHHNYYRLSVYRLSFTVPGNPIGLVDERARVAMERFGTEDQPALVAETDRYTIHQVRWPVLDGVTAEGLLLTPKSAPQGYVVALPDADQTPEQLTGLTPGWRQNRNLHGGWWRTGLWSWCRY